MDKPHSALLLVDMQVNMFSEPSGVARGRELIGVVQGLIARAQKAGAPVICIQNNGGRDDPDYPGTPAWELLPDIASTRNAYTVEQASPDSFHDTRLPELLQRHDIKHLVVAGVQTESCVGTTCRKAHALGYRVSLVKDGHSTFDSRRASASDIVAQHHAELAGVIAVLG